MRVAKEQNLKKITLFEKIYNFVSQSCVSSTTSNIKQATGRDLQAKKKIKQQANRTSKQNKQLAWRQGVRIESILAPWYFRSALFHQILSRAQYSMALSIKNALTKVLQINVFDRQPISFFSTSSNRNSAQHDLANEVRRGKLVCDCSPLRN